MAVPFILAQNRKVYKLLFPTITTEQLQNDAKQNLRDEKAVS